MVCSKKDISTICVKTILTICTCSSFHIVINCVIKFQKILEITEDFISEFPRRNKIQQKESDQSDNVDNLDLADDSFEADIKEQKTNVEDSSDVDNTTSHNAVNVTDTWKKDGAVNIAKTSTKHSEPAVPSRITDNNDNPPSDLNITGTPQTERKHLMAQNKIARLMSYGSPSVLSPLSAPVPRSVSKRFKPPAFKKL